MAWRFVKQPNGRLARFSQVVNDFTDYDLTTEEAESLCMSMYNMDRDEARYKVELGVKDDISWPVAQRRNDGLDRWRDALRVILAVHGVEVQAGKFGCLS